MGQAELLGQNLGLSALPGAGGAEKDDNVTYRLMACHLMKPS